MRFDIVLNNLAGLAWTIKEIKMTSEALLGVHWFVLISARQLYTRSSAWHRSQPNFQCGDTAHNYQVKEVAQIIAEIFSGCQLSFGTRCRQPQLSCLFEKINKTLPGFKCDWNAQNGAQQLFDLFTELICQKTPSCLGFTRLKQLEYLIRTQQIDKNFFWRQ